MKNKFKAVLMAFGLCSSVSIATPTISKAMDEGKMYVGISYKMAQSGKYSNKTSAAVGVFGVAHAAVNGAVYGAALGGPAGIIAGAVIGL